MRHRRILGMCRKQLPCFPEICYQALRSEPNREEGSMDAYAPEIERKMKRLFDSLSEDDRRRYAAVEATKLGHGGIEYIAQLLQCDPKTIRRGLAELDEAADLDTSRVRKKGGGRKKLIETSPTEFRACVFSTLSHSRIRIYDHFSLDIAG